MKRMHSLAKILGDHLKLFFSIVCTTKLKTS